MSHKHHDQLAVSNEWAKHLRPYHRRAFWKKERTAFRTFIATATNELGPRQLGEQPMPMKVQELIVQLEADGWFFVRQKGSHRQYQHPSKPGTVTVAGKPSVEVPPGTLNSVLKDAGLKK